MYLGVVNMIAVESDESSEVLDLEIECGPSHTTIRTNHPLPAKVSQACFKQGKVQIT